MKFYVEPNSISKDELVQTIASSNIESKCEEIVRAVHSQEQNDENHSS